MEQTENANATTKWLRYLFYAHLAGIVLSLFNWSWAVLASTAVQVFCLYKIIPLGERYRKAVIFGALALGLNVANMLLKGGTLLVLGISVLGFIATWQEYNAHSEVVGEKDEKLSRSWRSLFWWELVVGVLITVFTLAATVVLVLGEVGTAAITGIITMVMTGMSAVLGILYLVYLNRTVKLLEG